MPHRAAPTWVMLAEVWAEKLNTMVTQDARSILDRCALMYTLLPVPVGPTCGAHMQARVLGDVHDVHVVVKMHAPTWAHASCRA